MPKNKKVTSDNKLKVLEVKNFLPEIPLPRPIDKRLGDVHGVHLFVMKCKSGKSNLMANMLCNDAFYGGEPDIFEQVYVISPTVRIDKSSQIYLRPEMEDKFIIVDNIDDMDSIINNIIEYQTSEQFDIEDPERQPPRIAIVLDDISGKLKRGSVATHLFSRYRHFNASIFCSNQTCRDLPTVCRSMATCVYLSSCYSELERKKILEEWGKFFMGEKNLEKIWDDACEEQYNYLYLKLDDVKPRAFKLGKDGISEYYIDFSKKASEVNKESELNPIVNENTEDKDI